MGRADTTEHCRGCGQETLHSVYTHQPGMLVRTVLCPKCQDKRGIVKQPTPRKCPACKSQLELKVDRGYCNNKFCHAMVML